MSKKINLKLIIKIIGTIVTIIILFIGFLYALVLWQIFHPYDFLGHLPPGKLMVRLDTSRSDLSNGQSPYIIEYIPYDSRVLPTDVTFEPPESQRKRRHVTILVGTSFVDLKKYINKEVILLGSSTSNKKQCIASRCVNFVHGGDNVSMADTLNIYYIRETN